MRSLRHAKHCFLLLAVSISLGTVTPLRAQTGAGAHASPSGLWRDADEKSVLSAHRNVSAATARRGLVPSDYRTLHLDRALLAKTLADAPREFAKTAKTLEIDLPVPRSDKYARFTVEESPVMMPGLAARYPNIHTYIAHSVANPKLTARLDLTPQGFHALILGPTGEVLIDPYFADGTDPDTAIAYYKRDNPSTRPFECVVRQHAAAAAKAALAPAAAANKPTGTALRVYRLALAATAEYTAAVGGGSVDDEGTFLTPGTVAGALGAMVTTVNRVDGVYERDFAIRLLLIDNTDQLIYTDPTTEPYSNFDGAAMLEQNQNNVDFIIGDANYDIGHVFSTGGGGIAGLGVVGTPGLKAEGVTGSPVPMGDAFDIDYVAHEMGHEYGATHCFNSTTGGCGGDGEGNREADAAYEPGSGTTIMCYAGLCSDGSNIQDLANHSDDYFHTISYDQIDFYTTHENGQFDFQTLDTGNTPPVIATPTAYTIPIGTPFALTASATDAEGDALTYCWEEFDKGAAVNATTIAALDNGASPIFRSYPPTTSPTRIFPSLTYILNNANVPPLLTDGFLTGETLPVEARPAGLNFRCTVRDNRAGGGGSDYTSVTLAVAAGAGPFAVTTPNTAATLAGGTTQAVTWDVANTTAAPVSCANVRISLSTDGGLTFPYVLASSVPNTGSATVVLPNTAGVATTQGRIKVEAVGNIFFDISDADLTITSTAGGTDTPPTFTPSGSGLDLVRGTPADTAGTVGVITPGSNAVTSASVSGQPAGVTLTASVVNGTSVSLSGRAACDETTAGDSRTYVVIVTVTDTAGATSSGSVNVLVEPNPAPTLGLYTDLTVPQNATASAFPSAAPADENFNLSANALTVLPTTLPGGGTISVDQTTGAVSVAPTSASALGTTTVRVTCQDDCGAAVVRFFEVTVGAPINVPPVITSGTDVGGTIGYPINYQIAATNSPTGYGATGLPPGLSVNAATGLISGSPTQTGFFPVTLSTTNAFGTSTSALTVQVTGPALPVVTLAAAIPSVTLDSGEVGAFALTLSSAQKSDLLVSYVVQGTAANGVDYVYRKGTARIKAGRTTKMIKVLPTGDLGGASKKVVKLSLLTGSGYNVGTGSAAKVKIFAPQQ